MLTNTGIKYSIYLFINHEIVRIWTISYGPNHMDHIIWYAVPEPIKMLKLLYKMDAGNDVGYNVGDRYYFHNIIELLNKCGD